MSLLIQTDGITKYSCNMPDHAFDVTPQSLPIAAALGRLCLCVHAHHALLSSSGNVKWLTELTGL